MEVKKLMLESKVTMEAELFCTDFKFGHASLKYSNNDGPNDADELKNVQEAKLKRIQQKYKSEFEAMKRSQNISGSDLALACYFVSYYSKENQVSAKMAESLLDSDKVSDDGKDALEEFMIYW